MLDSLIYAIIFLLSLVISNILNKVFPKLPLPLIQVLMGLALGFFGAAKIIQIEPDVFLAFIIGPLLFREAQEANALAILKFTRLILILIFPLVFITALGIGYLSHALYAGIPLAAAFALGGALAPTDAIAVSSLSARLNFPKSIKTILKGEGMLNDASGIIAFQIALTALTTGYFSLFKASENLVISALGGFLVGIILVWLKDIFLKVLEDVAIQDVPGYLMIELLLPLVAFLIADIAHVSGIIAVVVTGILSENGVKRTSLFDAQIAQVKNTVWSTLSFILNSLVFLFLGIELYQFVPPLIKSPAYPTTLLIFLSVSLTVLLFVIRFSVISISFLFRSIRWHHHYRKSFKDTLILTFSGSKGTVSIAAILLIPSSATLTHSLLVFLCTAVTTLSFLTGMLLLPLFATKKNITKNNLTRISILSDVITELEHDMEELELPKHWGYLMTINSFQERIKTLIIEQENFSSDYNSLKFMMLHIESDNLVSSFRSGNISETTYKIYQRYLYSQEKVVLHHIVSSLQFTFLLIKRMTNDIIRRTLHIDFSASKKSIHQFENYKSEIAEIYVSSTNLILESLVSLKDKYDERLLNFLKLERLRTTKIVLETKLIPNNSSSNLIELIRGYYLERKFILEYETRGKLSMEEAMDLRKNVNIMEDFSIRTSDDSNFLVTLFTNFPKK